MNALIATCSEYTYLTSGKRVDGTMYSCTSLGTKLGGGLHIMYLWMPMCFNLLITLILTRLNVEKANEDLRKEHEAAHAEASAE